MSDTLAHIRGVWSQTVHLVGDHPYRLRLDWEPYDTLRTSGQLVTAPGDLTLGWSYVSGRIESAVAAARRADVAVVFAGSFSSEAFDVLPCRSRATRTPSSPRSPRPTRGPSSCSTPAGRS